MATQVQAPNTVAFPEQRSERARKRLINIDTYTAVRFRFTSILQTSLELEEVLALFFDQIKQEIPLGGLSYRHQCLKSPTDFGGHYAHNCHYELMTSQDNLGELSLSRNKRFTESELQLVEILIGCLILPLRNAIAYRNAVSSSLRDGLTGVGNRIAMDHTLDRDLALAKRHQHHYTAMIIDVDHFKKINDTYGHSIGDKVLIDVAKTIESNCRDTDCCFRYGGEEFVLALNQSNLENACLIAERIRKQIEAMTNSYNGHVVKVTVSIGVTALTLKDDQNSMFDRADRALYQAKRQGRNRTVVNDNDMDIWGATER